MQPILGAIETIAATAALIALAGSLIPIISKLFYAWLAPRHSVNIRFQMKDGNEVRLNAENISQEDISKLVEALSSGSNDKTTPTDDAEELQ